MRPRLFLLITTLAACGGTQSAPSNCEIRVDGQCYMRRATACEAAACPDERCTILRSRPGQVECRAEEAVRALRCDDLPASTTVFGIGAQEGQLTELVPERGDVTDSVYSLLGEVDLNGDAIPDYLETLVELVDESPEYTLMCNNVAQCYTRALVGCDDDRVAVVWGGDEADVELASEGRELAGLFYRDLLISQRLGGVAETEAMERGEEPHETTRLRIDDSHTYVRVAATERAEHTDASDGDADPFVPIHAAWGSGPNDIFAVGGGVLHYDGQTWEPMEVPLGERESIRSVWGSGATDVYVLAGDRILRYDGARWSETVAPELPMKRVVWGSGPDDVYIVSQSGRALHHDGSAFSTISIPVEDVAAMSGSGPDDVFVVGAHGAIARFDGESWRDFEPPTSDHFVAVHTVSRRLTYAVTNFSAVLQWNGRRWREDRSVPRADDGSDHAFAIWADAHDVYVGGEQSFVFVRNRRRWRRTEPVPSAMSERFTVWGNAENVYALGSQSSIFRLREGEWVRVHGE